MRYMYKTIQHILNEGKTDDYRNWLTFDGMPSIPVKYLSYVKYKKTGELFWVISYDEDSDKLRVYKYLPNAMRFIKTLDFSELSDEDMVYDHSKHFTLESTKGVLTNTDIKHQEKFLKSVYKDMFDGDMRAAYGDAHMS